MRLNAGCMLVLLAVGCGGDAANTVNQGTKINDTGELDETAPLIDHAPVEDAQQYEEAVTIGATVTDEASGVNGVLMYFKRSDAVDWENKALNAQGNDYYQANIPPAAVTGSGMNYYIESYDVAGNVRTYPRDGAADAVYFRVSAD
jgi:hypothetical protein